MNILWQDSIFHIVLVFFSFRPAITPSLALYRQLCNTDLLHVSAGRQSCIVARLQRVTLGPREGNRHWAPVSVCRASFLQGGRASRAWESVSWTVPSPRPNSAPDQGTNNTPPCPVCRQSHVPIQGAVPKSNILARTAYRVPGSQLWWPRRRRSAPAFVMIFSIGHVLSYGFVHDL